MPESSPQYPLLILDSASTNISIGIRLNPSDAGVWYDSDEQAGISIFRGIEFCLKKSQTTFKDLSSILYCAGPGSMLGIRTAAMALRTWLHTAQSSLSIYQYKSLSLAAAERCLSNNSVPFTIVLDARRSRWHTLTITEQNWQENIQSITSEDLSQIQHEIFLPEGFATWTELSFPFQKCSYTPHLFADTSFLRKLAYKTTSPNVFMTEKPIYQKWDATIRAQTKPKIRDE